MNFIEKMITEDSCGRFTLVLEDGRFRIWQDEETERLYCREQGESEAKWHEVAYVAAMQKQAWDDWAFRSPRDEDEFTDAIAFCPVSGEVTRDGIRWIVWFDICD